MKNYQPILLQKIGFFLPYPAIIVFGLIARAKNITTDNPSTSFSKAFVGIPVLLAAIGLVMIWTASFIRTRGHSWPKRVPLLVFEILFSTVLVGFITLSAFMLLVYLWAGMVKL